MKRGKISVLVLLAIVFLVAASVLAQEAVPEEKDQKTQVEEQGKTIISSPKDIKESTAIYVFIAWMWLSIIVLIFILKAKIREVDRLYRIRFFSSRKE